MDTLCADAAIKFYSPDARLARKTINLRSLPRDKIQSSMSRPNAPRYFPSFRTEISCLTPFYAARFLKFRRLARSGDEADLCGFELKAPDYSLRRSAIRIRLKPRRRGRSLAAARLGSWVYEAARIAVSFGFRA